MRLIKRLGILVFLALIVFAQPLYAKVYAQTPAIVTELELARNQQLTKDLSLSLPDVIDDPNYPITFVDPSKQGVDITVSEKTTTAAPSPFLLPNLAIGPHNVTFKFKTKEGLVKVLSKDIMVVPKAPQYTPTLKTVIVRPNPMIVSGTAIPQATILVVVNSARTFKVTSTTEGKWEFIIPEPIDGKNNILSFVIKNGYVSDASTPLSIEYKMNENITPTQSLVPSTTDTVSKAIGHFVQSIQELQKTQPALLYGIGGGALFILLLLIILNMRKGAAKSRDEKSLADLFGGMQNSMSITDVMNTPTPNVTKKGVVGKKVHNTAGGVKTTTVTLEQKVETFPDAPKIVTPAEKPKPLSFGSDSVAPIVKNDTVEKKPSGLGGFFSRLIPGKRPATTAPIIPEAATPIDVIKNELPVLGLAGKKAPKKEELETVEEIVAKKKGEEVIEADENDEEADLQPSKKVLTREEFLKQFQAKNAKDEESKQP